MSGLMEAQLPERLVRSSNRQKVLDLPGLRGFSARNLRYMRMFYEEWSELDLSGESAQIEQKSNLALTSAKSPS